MVGTGATLRFAFVHTHTIAYLLCLFANTVLLFSFDLLLTFHIHLYIHHTLTRSFAVPLGLRSVAEDRDVFVFTPHPYGPRSLSAELLNDF